MKPFTQLNLSRLTVCLTVVLALIISACKEDFIIQQEQAVEEGANYYPMGMNDMPAYGPNGYKRTDDMIKQTYRECWDAGFKTLRIEAIPDGNDNGVQQAKRVLALAEQANSNFKYILTYHKPAYMGPAAPSNAPMKAYNEFWDSMLDWALKYKRPIAVNILNEWGRDYIDKNNNKNNDWHNGYEDAIKKIMAHDAFVQGYVTDIIIDAPNYAHDYQVLLDGGRYGGKDLCNMDPKGRIAIGLHIYDFPVDGDYAYINSAKLKSIISKVGANNLIIGEIGTTFAASVSSKDVTQKPFENIFPTDFNLRDDLENVAKLAKSYKIPVISWCWSGDGSTKHKGGSIDMNASTNLEYRAWVKSLTY